MRHSGRERLVGAERKRCAESFRYSTARCKDRQPVPCDAAVLILPELADRLSAGPARRTAAAGAMSAVPVSGRQHPRQDTHAGQGGAEMRCAERNAGQDQRHGGQDRPQLRHRDRPRPGEARGGFAIQPDHRADHLPLLHAGRTQRGQQTLYCSQRQPGGTAAAHRRTTAKPPTGMSRRKKKSSTASCTNRPSANRRGCWLRRA
ncbi:MAG: hypothetical protein KatS3mg047_1507 [Bellilinea sp.]|nr:MAG: hypothetical protein KatS3mg047_1507 [Bellilinea sp.]